MLRALTFTMLFSISTCSLFTQQIASFGNIDIIDSYYNPAFTVFEDDIRFSSLYRRFQPKSSSLDYDWNELIILAESNLDHLNSGIGLKLHNRNDFITRSRTAELNYRYALDLR